MLLSIYIYIYTTILPLSCTDGRYFYHISGTALFRVNSDIFIIFRVHQVQLQKVPLNGNKKKGGSGVPRGLKKVYLVRFGLDRLSQIYKRFSYDPQNVKNTPFPNYYKDVYNVSVIDRVRGILKKCCTRNMIRNIYIRSVRTQNWVLFHYISIRNELNFRYH